MTSSFAPIEVELQVGPRATVAAGTEATITELFAASGLDVRWEPVPGDRSLEPGAPVAAQPSLHVFLNDSNAVSGADALLAIEGALTPALAAVRGSLEGLPVGLVVTTQAGRQRFSFRPSDTPDEIATAMSCAPEAATSGAAVLGWDAVSGVWRVL